MLEQQLPLPIQQMDDETLDNFYPENNLLLLNSLQKNINQLEQSFFYIWGEKSCGKTHLLKALTHHFYKQQRRAIYVPLSKACYFSPAVLENLEYQQLVCLDDIHQVMKNAEWEIAIFDLFNRIKSLGNTLLVVSSEYSPNGLDVDLPDLSSRLHWGEIYQLQGLNEKQKILVLQTAAHLRGIELPEDTAQFLLKRLDRDMQNLLNTLAELDKASLQAQRKLTIPFVKSILNI